MLPGLLSRPWLTMIISSIFHISAITGAMSGISGVEVWSNTAANIWQRRCTVPDADVEGTVELRYTDKAVGFFSPSPSRRRSETKSLRFVFSCDITWQVIFMAESVNWSFVLRNENTVKIHEIPTNLRCVMFLIHSASTSPGAVFLFYTFKALVLFL